MKKLISIILCISMAITVGCIVSGCGNDELLQRLDGMLSELQTQSEKIDGLQAGLQTQGEKIDELQTQNTQLTEKLKEMQTALDEQAKEIENLKLKTATQGEFYSLQEAYDNGYLTKEDLENIAYYNNNKLLTYPETIDETVAALIKEDAANIRRNQDKLPILDAKAEDFEILKYYGTYNGCYVVLLNEPYDKFFTVIIDEWVTIGGVEFHYIGHLRKSIWKVKI